MLDVGILVRGLGGRRLISDYISIVGGGLLRCDVWSWKRRNGRLRVKAFSQSETDAVEALDAVWEGANLML